MDTMANLVNHAMATVIHTLATFYSKSTPNAILGKKLSDNTLKKSATIQWKTNLLSQR